MITVRHVASQDRTSYHGLGIEGERRIHLHRATQNDTAPMYM